MKKETKRTAKRKSIEKIASSVSRSKRQNMRSTRGTRIKVTRRQKIFFGIIPIVLLLLVSCIYVYLMRDKLVYYTADGELCTYYMDSRFVLGRDVPLVYDAKEGKTFTKEEFRTEFAQDLWLPLYYTEKNAVLTPRPLVYCDSRSLNYNLLPVFSDIKIAENGNIVMSDKRSEAAVSSGFLYDGKDIYIFLEPVTLRVNGYQFELSRLSYVEAQYGGMVTVFDYETRGFYSEELKDEPLAYDTSKNFEIHLLSDEVENSLGRFLIFSSPDLLEPII